MRSLSISDHKHLKRGLTEILAVAVALTLLLSPLLSGCGEGEPQDLPSGEEESVVNPISGLSVDQSGTVEDLGYPDHFFISIDPATSDRIERWTYFSDGKAIDFDNGRFFGEENIDDQSSDYPPTDLHPQDFDTLMTPGEAEQLLGQPIYTYEVQDSLMPENTIIVYEKAVLLYRNGQLLGVDTQVHPPQL
jgi:hypothetical protein